MPEDPHDFMSDIYLLQQREANIQNKYPINDSSLHLRLLGRSKNTHLSLQKKEYIFELARKYPKDLTLICQCYKLSKSTINRILRSHSNTQKRLSESALSNEDLNIDSKMLSKTIHKIVKPP